MTEGRTPGNAALPTRRRRYAAILLRLCVAGMAVTLAVIAILQMGG